MARFNTAPRLGTRSPVTTTSMTTPLRTAQGGQGMVRDARSELFLSAISDMTGDTFYESQDARAVRTRELIAQVADDTRWLRGFISFLRNTANLRTVSLRIAADAVKIRLDRKIAGGNRELIEHAIGRADEPGELLAYWVATYGRAVPKPVKRGIADAIMMLWTEKSYLKWDSAERGYRFSDVLQIVHPEPGTPTQSELFKFILDNRYATGTVEVPTDLTIIAARAELMALPVEQRRDVSAGGLFAAGMTWEAMAGWLQGELDAAAWEKIIPSMGYMALLRNLRNFDKAGISTAVRRQIEDKLTDPDQVLRSRQLPMRFLSAYRATRDSGTVTAWGPVIEQALNLSLANVPRLGGRTLVLVDLSGSMYNSRLSDKSDLRYVDAAAIFGAAIARRCETVDLHGFGWEPRRFATPSTGSLLPLADAMINTTIDGTSYGYRGSSIKGLGGTDTMRALRETFRAGYHDRIVMVTDEQYTSYGWGASSERLSVEALLDQFGVPSYTWNLAGYKAAQSSSGSRKRHTFGGLSDSSFRLIPLIEAGQTQDWDALFHGNQS